MSLMKKEPKRIRRGAKMAQVLTTLGNGAFYTLDLLDEFFNYQKSYRRARQRLYDDGGYSQKSKLPQTNAKFQAFYSLLTRLKNEGLIEKSKNKQGTLWRATVAGLEKLTLLKEKEMLYNTESDDKSKIIAFDVPEREKMKRHWLREALRIMNFRMLQKSLWIGKNKIPEAFLEDLRRKNILSYVHIFEVSRAGTIKEIA